MDKFPYKVYNRDGRLMFQTKEGRYPKAIERSLLEAGYTIKINGKRITKKETK